MVVVSEELEIMMNNLADGIVPVKWKYLYYSLKPLGSWMDDLVKRV